MLSNGGILRQRYIDNVALVLSNDKTHEGKQKKKKGILK